MKKNYLLIAVIMFIAISINSQNSNNFCGFDQLLSKKIKDPVFASNMEKHEKKLQTKISELRNSKKSEEVLTIPVVFHVFHGGEALGTGLNILDSEIQRMLDAMNDFYRGRTGENSLDFKIEFELATRNENCSTTSGIVRADASGVANYLSEGLTFDDGVDGGASLSDLLDLTGKWDGTIYFNMYGIYKYASGAVGTGRLFGSQSGTGEIICPIGAIGADNMRLYIHEIGHYLNLHHTFEGDKRGDPDAEPIYCPTGDGDFCDDTEPHTRANSGYPMSLNICNAGPWLNNNSLKNHMSYFGDTSLMTNDQKLRIRALLEGTRLVNSPGLVAPPQNWSAPLAVCLPNSATRSSGQVGITSVEINGFKVESFASATDIVIHGGNVDLSSNCNNMFTIDGKSNYNIEVNFPKNAPATNLHQLGVWIDWNNDGDFDDDNEQQYLEGKLDPATPVQISVSYPSKVTYNSFVRIRLIADIRSDYSQYGAIDSACFSPREGQSEDYTIYIESESLSNQDYGFETINVFSNNDDDKIEINGNFERVTKALLYDIQGRLVVQNSFSVKENQNYLNTKSLGTGIYILKLDNGVHQINKKLLIE